jgi:hypothetical protein
MQPTNDDTGDMYDNDNAAQVAMKNSEEESARLGNDIDLRRIHGSENVAK